MTLLDELTHYKRMEMITKILFNSNYFIHKTRQSKYDYISSTPGLAIGQSGYLLGGPLGIVVRAI